MQAILSDIHGNLEALTAVLADIERVGVTAIVNLGDTLGYGPNPVECLDIARWMTVVLLGNFDHAVLFKPDAFPLYAGQSVLWTEDQLEAESDPAARSARVEFLLGLTPRYVEADVLYVHGSPRNPLNEHVVPEDVYATKKMSRLSKLFDRICFAGHTHMPGVFVERDRERWEFLTPEECDGGLPVAGSKLICNVGAVGQPRDGDPRACYALFDGERVWFRRVDYDIGTTVRKIYAEPRLADFFADRLREGR